MRFLALLCALRLWAVAYLLKWEGVLLRWADANRPEPIPERDASSDRMGGA